jgi:hypothetical protein
MHLFRRMSPGELLLTLLAFLAASVSPLAFSMSATGAITMHTLGRMAILPALIGWVVLIAVAMAMGYRRLAASGRLAVIAGILATAAMEVVRITGFRLFDAMPGSLPMLIGVQLTDQFMDGPNLWSNFLGWGDHLWNGIGFAFIYIAVFGRARWWVGGVYALLIGTVFMLSPVMNIIGAGAFGQDYAPIKFPLTVYLAHIAYGLVLGWVAQRSPSTPANLFQDLVGSPKST